MQSAFPAEVRGIDRFFDHIFNLNDEVRRLTRSEQGAPSVARAVIGYPLVSPRER